MIASEKAVWFDSVFWWSDGSGQTLRKVFKNWSHLSGCGAVESDAVKSLDKYACHKNEVALIYF